MKKLTLAGILCVAAFMVVPIASASAETFTGKCTVQGTAEFFNNEEPSSGADELSAASETLGYTFTSETKNGVAGVVCVDESGEVSEGHAAGAASVKNGEFTGTCETATSVDDGEGTLKVKGVKGGPVKTANFNLDFTAAGGSVALEIEKSNPDVSDVEPAGADEVTAHGLATFFASKEEPAANCPTTGVKKLEFDAETAGTLES